MTAKSTEWHFQSGSPMLPRQDEGEHNALADAKWNKKAWEFLKQYDIDCSAE